MYLWKHESGSEQEVLRGLQVSWKQKIIEILGKETTGEGMENTTCLEFHSASEEDLPGIIEQLEAIDFVVVRSYMLQTSPGLSPFPCAVIRGDSEKILNYLFEAWKSVPSVHDPRSKRRDDAVASNG